MRCPSCGCDNLPGAGECEHCRTSLYHEDVPRAPAGSRVERTLCEERIARLHPSRHVSVTEETTIAKAIRTMRAEQTGCLLITDAKGGLAGIFTERDVLTRVAGRIADLDRQTVGGVMTPHPETVRRGHPLAHALQRMMVGDFRYMPVVDRKGGVVGILSSRDIIGYIATLLRASGGD